MMEETVDSKLESILEKVHGNKDIPEMDLMSLELAKMIVLELLDDANLESLSIISSEQVNDITNGMLLNEFYQLPQIDNYIKNFLTLKRSTGGFMVHHLTKLGTVQTFEEPTQNQGFFSKLLRRP